MKIWTLTDGHPGMNSQVRGLAEALGFETLHKKAERKMPWGLLPITWSWGALGQAKVQSDSLLPPYPDILITCGRRAIPFSLDLHRTNKGKTFRIHIQDPRLASHYFDQVIVPEHDRLRGPNVLVATGSLHHLTPEKLGVAAREWEKAWSTYPRPLTTFVLGGHTNRYRFTATTDASLLKAFQNILDQGGSLLILSSFRTPSALKEQIVQHVQNNPHRLFFYDGNGPNPYLGSLALADQIVVTNDSANMMSEACLTGKPVFIFPLPDHRGTPPCRCAETLQKLGAARPFSLPFSSWSYTPIQEAQRLSLSIQEALALKNRHFR